VHGHSIGVMVTDEKERETMPSNNGTPFGDNDALKQDPEALCIREYSNLLVRHTTQSSVRDHTGLMATSPHINGHTTPIMRLAMSVDQSFCVSASHDGTRRGWEFPQMEN
jgi:hypothetical protein